MGFFHLVEKDDAVGLAPDFFAELSALLVADVSGRGTDQAGDRVLLHVFRHVEADDCALVVEEKFRERLRKLGLADTGRAEKQERSDRTVFVLESGACAAYGIRRGLDRLLLADDALHEALLHFDQLRALTLLQARDRDAGPSGDDFCDVFFGYFLLDHRL